MMNEDQCTCNRGEFNAVSIPPLLLQFYLDRMSEIVVTKHLLMLRWKRYCSETLKVEQVYKDYLDLLE